MLDYLNGMLENLPAASARLVILIAWAFVFWKLINLITKFDDDHELFEKQNYAYLVQRLALIAAFIVGSLPTLTNHTTDREWIGLLWQLLECLWVLVALLLARFVVDKLVLPQFSNLKEILRGNLAVAIVEAGFYIGLGFILAGSLTGDAPSTATGLASTVVFALLGTAVLVGVFWLHELVTPWHLRDHIAAGHVSSALEVGGLLVAIGIVTRVGVAGDFTTWEDGLIAFSATVMFAIPLLYLARWVFDKVILTGCTVASVQAKNQVVAACLLSGLFVLIAPAVATVVATHL